MYPIALHRDPRFYTDPETFNPDRFQADAAGGIPAGAYLPFGVGPHTCIGMNLALRIISTIVRVVLARGRLVRVGDAPGETAFGGLLRPDRPQLAVLHT